MFGVLVRGASQHVWLTHSAESNFLTSEMLISSIREDASTQTLEDEQDSPQQWVGSQSSGSQSEGSFPSRSDIIESDQYFPHSVPASDGSNSCASGSEGPLRPGSLSASDRSDVPYSSRLSEVGPESSHDLAVPIQGNIDQSTSEAAMRLCDIRIRVRDACIRSLILTNRVHSLQQKITLEKIRSQES